MTNRFKFRVGNIGHGRYIFIGAWLLNFCHGFSNSLGTFSSIMEPLRKQSKVLRIGGKGDKNMAAGCKCRWESKLCHGRPGF